MSPKSPKSARKAKAAKMSKSAARTERLRKEALAEIGERLNAAPTPDVGPDVGPGSAAAEPPPAQDAQAKGPRRGGTSGKSAATPPTPKPAKVAKPAKPKRLSGLDAAALVLSEAKAPMSVAEVFKVIEERGLWRTEGKTPSATLYAAIIREIRAKKQDARFKKTDRGRFVHSGKEVD